MGAEAATNSRLRLVLAAAFLLITASCSVTDDLFQNQSESTGSERTGESAAEVAADGDAAEPQRVAAEQEPLPLPPIWVKGDDSSMRPTAQHAAVNDSMAPGNGQGWSVVGSIYDYETGDSEPAIWTASEPSDRDSWSRVDLPLDAADGASLSAAVRADGFDVAVGDYGQGLRKRPAVWLRSAGADWRTAELSQFDRGVPEGLRHVGVDRATGLILAVGEQDGPQPRSTVWVSADGDVWEAIEDLPFAVDGTLSLDALAVGSDVSVLTGQRSGLMMTGVAFWSQDGRRWGEAEVETPSGGRSYLGESTWFNDRFVAVGGVAVDDVFRPAAWTSTDGRTWRLQQTPFETMDDGRANNVGFGASQITSTGSVLYAAADSGFQQQLWRSSDGTDWTLVGDIAEVRGQALSVNSIVASGDQVLLTTEEPGVVVYNEGFERAAVRSDLLPVPEEYPWVSGLAYIDGGWIAAGGSSVRIGWDRGSSSNGSGDTNEVALLWRSADGVDWDVAERLPEASTGPVAAIAPLDGGLVAVGTETLRSANAQRRYGRGLIWQLAGSDWVELDAPPATEDQARIGLLHAARAGDDLLAGGWRFVPGRDNTDVVLMQRRGQGVPEVVDIGYQSPDNETLMALCGNAAGDAVVVVSTQDSDTNRLSAVRRGPDGSWSAAEWPLLSQGERATVAGCTYGVDGFIAGGGVVRSDGDVDVGVWRSANGATWERVEGPTAFSASTDQTIDSIVAAEDGYLMVGTDGSSGEYHQVVWYGSGEEWDQVFVDKALTMGRLQIGYGAGTIVIAGWDDGAVRIYSTTLDQLLAEIGRS